MTNDVFIEAVKRNSQRLYVIAFSYLQNKDDAEDALQNTFLKLWKYNKSFESNEHMDKWLTRVCINDCKNVFALPFRKHKSLEDEYDLSTFDSYFNLDLYNAILSLNKKERLVIILFYYNDLPTKEISSVTGINESTIKSLLKRSREKLKQKLGDEWIYEE